MDFILQKRSKDTDIRGKTIAECIEARTSKDKRFLYHITLENWGNKRRLIPLPDDHPKIMGRGYGEPDIARICVGPTPSYCLSAIYWYISREKTVNIYRTSRKVHYIEPWDVSDSAITHEKWLLKPTTFVKVGYISRKIIRELPTEMEETESGRQNQITTLQLIKTLLNETN